MQKLALKLLTKSDLTLFKWHYDNQSGKQSKQKAINLNADVFVDKLYPSVRTLTKLPLDLHIFGPGLADEYVLQRKIIKQPSYKNWRLDGELIPLVGSPDDRFKPLGAGDLAVFAFDSLGESGVLPTSAQLVLLAENVKEDHALHAQLRKLVQSRSMVTITLSDLVRAIEVADVVENHPIRELLALDAALEDIALGGSRELARVAPGKRKTVTRDISPEELAAAKRNAEAVGREGEEVVRTLLEEERRAGRISGFEWVSETKALSPYDFTINLKSGDTVLADAKSTKFGFDRPIHISRNELEVMAEGSKPYHIYRVYGITKDEARVRIATDLRVFASDVLKTLNSLPEAVTVDSVSVTPSALGFGAESKRKRKKK